MDDYESRFGGISRLYGTSGVVKLRAAHVCVIGIGGVGAWTAEAAARSGIGAITLVDLDEICVTNINRQLHALTETIGQRKVVAMAARIRSINPGCRVTAVEQFFNDQTSAAILSTAYDHVVDAIDSVAKKTLLLKLCREKNIPVTCCGGAGGRRDATQIRTADLSRVSHDRLLAAVRKKLRQEFGFPADGTPMGLPCVYSAEPPVFAQPDGSVCADRPGGGEDTRLNCNGGLGSATFVTGAFGFAAAGLMVESIVSR